MQLTPEQVQVGTENFGRVANSLNNSDVTRRDFLKATAAGGLGLLVGAIGASRVVLGAHWPSDVVAGVVVGCAWVAVCVPVLNAVDDEGKRKAAKTE